MSKISVVINTYNEEKTLPKALDSVKKLADEVVVCDMHSSDQTVEIAKKAGAKVYKHKRVDYVEPARNFAISKATGDWVLILDPDEEISSSLAKKLLNISKKPGANYYRLPRKNLVFNKWLKHSLWWPDYNIRFFKKGSVSWNEVIHAVPMTQGKGKDLDAKETNAIIHHHYKSIDQYLERLNRYTTVQKRIKEKEGYKFNYLDLIKKPIGEFLSRFFYGEGYKDGLHGIALAALQGFSEFILYLKLWQDEGFKEEKLNLEILKKETKNIRKEVNYWFADSLVKETGSVVERIKRKFRIF